MLCLRCMMGVCVRISWSQWATRIETHRPCRVVRAALNGSRAQALLFEDVFKNFNAKLKKEAENILLKHKAAVFDISKSMNAALITNGLKHAISSGNWAVKRFRMSRSGRWPTTPICTQAF